MGSPELWIKAKPAFLQLSELPLQNGAYSFAEQTGQMETGESMEKHTEAATAQ